MSLAENLIRLQAEHGESNYRLAKDIDVSETSVSNWRKGICTPHPKMRKKIAKHYKITVDELCGTEGV